MRKQFPHRRNEDGSFDSICHRCFRTIGREKEEEKLRAAELKHVYEDLDLSFLVDER